MLDSARPNPLHPAMTIPVLIIDFGSQVTQLIARRVREAGVYCEIVPFNQADAALAEGAAEGHHPLRRSGVASPNTHTPRAPQAVFEMGVPVLGICYGHQTMMAQLGGRVEPSTKREFGRAQIEVTGQSPLFDNIWQVGARDDVWMSHGDKVAAIPESFRVVAASEIAPYAIVADEKRKFYGVMFHPEVVHTPKGGALLRNFVLDIAHIAPDWNMHAFKEDVHPPHPRAGRPSAR